MSNLEANTSTPARAFMSDRWFKHGIEDVRRGKPIDDEVPWQKSLMYERGRLFCVYCRTLGPMPRSPARREQLYRAARLDGTIL